MSIVRVYIVQSRDSGLFLCPSDNGDVGHTEWVKEAGHFETKEEAIETAYTEIGERFDVFGFWLEI